MRVFSVKVNRDFDMKYRNRARVLALKGEYFRQRLTEIVNSY